MWNYVNDISCKNVCSLLEIRAIDFEQLLSWKKTTVEIKSFKRGKTLFLFANKPFKEARAEFLTEHDKKEFNSALILCTLKKISIRTFLIHLMN